jgi:hypothetical protein
MLPSFFLQDAGAGLEGMTCAGFTNPSHQHPSGQLAAGEEV